MKTFKLTEIQKEIYNSLNVQSAEISKLKKELDEKVSIFSMMLKDHFGVDENISMDIKGDSLIIMDESKQEKKAKKS